MGMAMGVVIGQLTCILVWLIMSPFVRPPALMMRVSPTDFQRLLAREPQAVVFWKMVCGWEGYLYISSAGGLQIYTKSKQKLEFPESCELIMMQN